MIQWENLYYKVLESKKVLEREKSVEKHHIIPKHDKGTGYMLRSSLEGS